MKIKEEKEKEEIKEITEKIKNIEIKKQNQNQQNQQQNQMIINKETKEEEEIKNNNIHRWTWQGPCPKDTLQLQQLTNSHKLSPSPTNQHHSIHQSPSHSPKFNHQNRPSINKKYSLTQSEIKAIEKLGVTFMLPTNNSTGQSTTHFTTTTTTENTTTTTTTNTTRPISLQQTTLVRPTIRRNSIISHKPRRSIKLQSNYRFPICPHQNSTLEQGTLRPIPISSNQLLDLITSKSTQDHLNLPPLLVIDLRSLNSYLGPNGRLKGSINVNFPSLLIKRFLKGTPSNFQLHPFITTEAGKRYYSRLEKTYNSRHLASPNATSPNSTSPNSSSLNSSSVLEQLDICIIDDQIDDPSDSGKPHHPDQQNPFGKLLLGVLCKWLNYRGRTAGLFYLSDRFEELLNTPAAQKWLVFGEQSDPNQQGAVTHPQDLNIHSNESNLMSSNPKLSQSLNSSSTPQRLPRLKPSAPTLTLPYIDTGTTTITLSPSPILPNETISLNTTPHKPKPPKLRRIDTSESILISSSRLSSLSTHSKQSLAPLKTDPQTLNMFPKTSAVRNSHPDHSKLSCGPSTFANLSRSPLGVGEREGGPSSSSQPTSNQPQTSLHNGYYDRTSCSPTQSVENPFKVSTIIPSFLYLGPEPTRDSDFEELKKLGIKVILNVALECPKPEILNKKKETEEDNFIEKYHHIPLRDFVEEAGIQAGIQKSNQILNHAFLFQLPTFVHCKAGKSRSVTIVLAYLIHRYRWDLKQSYAHVSERRKGVCPNIGFLAELMNFEEREIGIKSRGIAGTTSNKGGRSASHHFTYSTHNIIPPKYDGEEGQGLDKNGQEEKGLSGKRMGFQDYSIDGLGTSSPHYHHPTKSTSFDPRRHHGVRVRSVALGSKTDFFSSLVKPPANSNLDHSVEIENNLNLRVHHSNDSDVESVDHLPPTNDDSLLLLNPVSS